MSYVLNLLNSFDFHIQVKLVNMQDTNEDTEWNDVLRAKGIIPDKPKEAEINEDDVIAMMEKTIKQKSGGMNLDFFFHHSSSLIQKIINF